MKPEYEKYDLIERYLKGELSEIERADFEQKLDTDDLLMEEVENHRAIHDLIIDQGLLELKAKMKAFDAGQTGKGYAVRILSTVVLVTSLVAVGLVVFNKRTDTPGQPAATAVNPSLSGNDSQTEEGSEKVTAKPPAIITPSQTTHPVNAAERDNGAGIIHADTAHITQNPVVAPLRDTTGLQQVITRNTPVITDVVPALPQVGAREPEPLPCKLEKSTLKFSVSESCATSPTGILSIDETSSFEGKLPVVFSLDGKNYTEENVFHKLYPGTYYLSVRDARGCYWHEATEIVIGEKDCTEKEYSFYPSRGEVWKFPVTVSSGKMEIYSRNGTLIYTTAITQGYPDQWDGTYNGNALPMGSYSFILRGDGKVITGFVTLFR